MIKQSFTLRVLVISFLLLALPLIVDSFIFFQDSYQHAIADAKLKLREAAKFRTFTLAEIQPVKQVLLEELNYLLDLGENENDLGSEKTNQLIEEIAHIGENFQIFILDLGNKGEYKIVASSMPSFRGSTLASFMKLKSVLEVGEGTFMRYIYSNEQNRYVPFVFLARVIHSKQTQKPIGLLLVMANIEKQLDSILSLQQRGEKMQFALLNNDGIVFAATDPKLKGKYFDPLSEKRQMEILRSTQLGPSVKELTPVPVIEGNDPPYFEFIFADQVQIAYRAYVSDFGISVVSYSPKEAFFGQAVRHFLFVYTVYALLLVIGGGITYSLSVWISRPLRQLSQLMAEVGQGNLAVRFHKEPFGFEINLLGEIFNQTLVNLLENIQKTEDEKVKLETYQRELAIGREVQHSLIPTKVPKVKGVEAAGVYLPANEVGGDYYGFLQRELESGEEVLVISVADAAGKGISSCLYSLSARSLFQTFMNLVDDPGEALHRTNNAFVENTGDTGMFVTFFAGMYHSQSKTLSYYSCGHVPPILRRKDGSIHLLAHSGMALGLKESEGYPSESIQLESGDLVVFYTNGLTEAFNDKNQHFSERRLKSLLQQRIWNGAQEAIIGLSEELRLFTGNVLQDEEVIIVALKVE